MASTWMRSWIKMTEKAEQYRAELLSVAVAFIEKYPEYGRTRRFFFGLVKVRHWGYRCELTNPLIDLMMADLPHTLFNPKDTRAEEIANDPSIELNMQAAMRKKERMEREQREKEGKLTLDDVFNESAE